MVRVKNLPNNIECHEVRTLIKKFGKVKKMTLFWRQKRDAEVELTMSKKARVHDAVDFLNGIRIDGRVLVVELVDSN